MARLLDSMRWYKSRLAAMDVPELRHRIAEQFARSSGRRFNEDWSEISVKGNLVELPNVYCACNEMPEALKVRIAEQARKIIGGQFEFLGEPWTHASDMPPAPEFWHLDAQGTPWSGRDEYCFDIPYRGRADREIKHTWELNRLQFLVPLAVHARLTNECRTSKLVLDVIRSWMHGNPPYQGVNWISGVELALRAISVAIAISIVGLEGLEKGERIDIERFFSAHLFWLRRYPSLHSSENNHRIAELAGSLICAAFAPGIDPEMESSRELDQLMIQLQSQILEDGIGAEQSPTYAAFSIELALTAFVSLNVVPERMPTSVRGRLLAWVDYVQWISSPTGDVPAIGDCDDGKVVGIEASPGPHYVVSIAKSVTNYLNHPLSLPSRCDFDLRDALFFPPRTSSVAPLLAKPPTGTKTWEVGGYSVWRRRTSNPIVLVFDHGSLGYLSIAAHGHADALSVWLSIGDTPVIVDAGTHVYNSAPLWRERLRSSMSHNTLSIDGVSSSSTSGAFNWAAKADARLICGSTSRSDKVVAEHDGYLKRFGVRHRRTVSMSEKGRVSLADELVGGSDPLPVQISFLINPGLAARTHDSRRNSILVEDAARPVAEFGCDGVLQPRIVFGDDATGRGWVSPSFGRLRAAHQILFEGLLSKRSIIEIIPLAS
jgi:hypothetical protein